MSSQITTADGVQLYVEVHGDGEPLILVTGLAASMEWWRRAIPPLTGSGFRVAAHDLRGVARSGPAEDVSMAAQARDVIAVADANDWGTFSVAGLSFGGMVVQELLCTSESRRVRRAVLITSGPSTHPTEYLADMSAVDNPLVTAMLSAAGQPRDAQLRAFEPHFFTDRFRAEHADSVDTWREAMTSAESEPDPTVRAAYAAASATHDRSRDLATIKTPVLSIIGTDDEFVWPALQLADAAAIPGAIALQLTGGRHGLVWESVETWVPFVRDFLHGDLSRRD